MIRLGLCCKFASEPIKFRTTTATAIGRMARQDALAKLAGLCRDNASALLAALEYCDRHGVGDFRISSRFLPLKSHPSLGYQIDELPGREEILAALRACREFAAQRSLRTTLHPDQFVVLNSQTPGIVADSLRELEYHGEVAEWIGVDVINIHAGAAYGDKRAALERFRAVLPRLSDRVRKRLTLENDDRLFTPRDLLPICRAEQIPLVYDVHHHRCHPDGLGEAEATLAALETWKREAVFHISSPLNGWDGPHIRRHSDYIDPGDFPACWRDLDVTVEVEAKAKELAVHRLKRELDI
jgi:UV DNA damage endonuclease